MNIQTCVEVKPKVSPEAIEAAVSENRANAPIIAWEPAFGTTNDQSRDALALLTKKRWENGRTLRVWFDKAGQGVVERVKPYFLEWTNHANIRFEFVDVRDSSEIRVGFVQGDGSWSYLGTDNLTIPKSEHTCNFGWLAPNSSETEYKRVVLHEVGHALCAVHEHQSPSGGVPWDRPAVLEYYQGPPNYWSLEDIEHNVFYRYSESQTNFTDFDRKSIMAYPVDNALTIGDYFVPFNSELSTQDKEFIAWVYPKAPSPPPKPPVETETWSKTRFDDARARTLRTKRLILTDRGTRFGEFTGDGS